MSDERSSQGRRALTRDEVIRRIGPAHDERVSFAGEDLAGVDLSRGSFQRIDFTGANLRGADLGDSRLDGADFSEADLTGARMERASMRHTWLKWARLAGADLRGADLTGALLGSADLATARVRGAFVDGAELSGAELPARWAEITRHHQAWELPFERRDVVAAVRRALADEGPAPALTELIGALGSGAAEAPALLQLLVDDPGVLTLAELRGRDLPQALDATIARVTTPPPPGEVGAALEALAGADRETCRSRGLRWTISRGIARRDGLKAIALLRLAGSLGLQEAKVLADSAASSAEIVLEACGQVDDGLLAEGAEALVCELWGLDFDWTVRLLWCLRAGLQRG